MFRARIAGQADIKQFEKAVDLLFDRLRKNTFISAQANTPVRSGRARASWQQQDLPSGFSVSNSVPYIEQLEKGRSRQAPKGIIRPTTRSQRRTLSQHSRLQSGRLSR